MTSRLLSIAALVILTACHVVETDQASNQVNATSESHPEVGTEEPATRAAFPMDEISAEDLMAAFNNEWSGPIAQNDSDDSLTDGRHKMLMFKDRSLNLYILPDGRVWRLRANVGMGDRCGSRAEVKQVVEHLARTLMPHADASHVLSSIGGSSIAELDADEARLTVSNACVNSITLTAKNGPSS